MFSFTLFADDTSIFYKNTSLNQLLSETLTNSVSVRINKLTKLSVWFKAKKLSLNISNTTYMLFSNRKYVKNETINFEINESIINRASECKFLGTITDENLTWKPHINLITNKVSKRIGIMYKVGQFLTKKQSKLYTTLLYTHISTIVILFRPTIILQDCLEL